MYPLGYLLYLYYFLEIEDFNIFFLAQIDISKKQS